MLISSLKKTVELGTVAQTSTIILDLTRLERYSAQVEIDVNTPSAKSFATTDVNVTNNTITEAAHGFPTGLKGQASTTDTLPAGLALTTDYFVIVVDADTYKLATSLVNALAGTAIDITDQGAGTHTFTPTALAGGAIKLQKSNKPAVLASGYTYASTDWTDVAAATSVTADATFWAEVDGPTYLAACLHFTLTAGSAAVTAHLLGRELE